MVATGTCSSTGYSANYGPVPHCPKGTGWWFGFLFGGVWMVVLGAFVSGGSTLLLLMPTLFTAIGAGALTVGFDSHAAHGAKTFGYIFGGAFAAAGLIPLVILVVVRLRKVMSGHPAARPPTALASSPLAGNTAFGSPHFEPDAILGAYAQSASVQPVATTVGAAAGSPARSDVFDKIAKLSELHKSGALTDDEFSREKAKLLAELS
jgi:Short C-terminal domain